MNGHTAAVVRALCSDTRPSPSLTSGTQPWRLFAVVATLVVSTAVWRPLAAQATDIPPVVTKGFDAYQTNGAGAAVNAWLVGSPFAGQATMRGNTLQGFLNVESNYGHYTGYDVLKTVPLGTRVRRVYVITLYERGPLYIYFDCYQASAGWEISTMQLSAKASEVLPADMLSR